MHTRKNKGLEKCGIPFKQPKNARQTAENDVDSIEFIGRLQVFYTADLQSQLWVTLPQAENIYKVYLIRMKIKQHIHYHDE